MSGLQLNVTNLNLTNAYIELCMHDALMNSSYELLYNNRFRLAQPDPEPEYQVELT